LRASGARVANYLVDLQVKLAFPLVNLIVILIGAPLATRLRMQSAALGFGLSIAISFCYYALLRTGQALGHSGALNPYVAGWLGDLVGEKGGVFEPEEQFLHARTGRQIRPFRAWTYEPATQTAISTTRWEAIGSDGQVVDRWQTEPIRLHCVFRFEMEHLLARAGFCLEDVYGDFYRNPLENKSSNMIWVAHKAETSG
jgi:hypothetical protein